MIDLGIVISYILSCFFLGFIIGKRTKSRRFLWGILGGILYFMILVIMSMAAQNSFSGEGKDILTTFMVCVGSGALGGMLS